MADNHEYVMSNSVYGPEGWRSVWILDTTTGDLNYVQLGPDNRLTAVKSPLDKIPKP